MLRKVVVTVSLAVIGGFIFGFLTIAYGKLFGSFEGEFAKNIYGAFLGAFFALLFTRIGDVFEKIYARQVKGLNALVEMEHHLNKLMAINSDNLFVLKDFEKVVKEALAKGHVPLYPNRTHPYELREDLTNFSDIVLINEIFSFNLSAYKINSSLVAFTRQFEEIQNLRFQQHIEPASYKVIMLGLLKRLPDLRKFLISFNEEIVELAATVRVSLTDKPMFAKLVQSFVLKKRKRDFERKVQIEKNEIQSEIGKIRSESEVRIQKIMGLDVKETEDT